MGTPTLPSSPRPKFSPRKKVLIVFLFLLVLSFSYRLFFGSTGYKNFGLAVFYIERAPSIGCLSVCLDFRSNIVNWVFSANPFTFKPLSIEVGKDSNNLFIRGKSVEAGEIDLKTLVFVPETLGSGFFEGDFFKDSQRVYWLKRRHSVFYTIENADPNTFRFIHEQCVSYNCYSYIADSNNVYYFDDKSDSSTRPSVFSKIPGADPQTFRVNERSESCSHNSLSLASDAKTSYGNGVPLPGNFSYLDGNCKVIKSSDHVYVVTHNPYNLILTELDPDKTVVTKTTASYIKDDVRLVFVGNGVALPGANPDDFEVIYETSFYNIVRSGNNIYNGSDLLEDVDIQTFRQVLGLPNGYQTDYFIDKNHVYFRGLKIENADPNTFVVGPRRRHHSDLAEDVLNYYYYDYSLDQVIIEPKESPID